MSILYTMVIGDFNANREMNKLYGNGNRQIAVLNEKKRGNTLVEWATSRKYKIMNNMFQKKSREEMDVKKHKRYNEGRN